MMPKTEKSDAQRMNNQLSLEESFKDGYRNGKWHAHNSEGMNTYYFAFSPDGPVLEIEISDNLLNKVHEHGKLGIFEEELTLGYHPEYDSVSVLDRGLTQLRDDKPSYGYFKRLGYLNSDDNALLYYISAPIRGIFGLAIDISCLLSVVGAGSIQGRQWWESYWVADAMAEIGKEVRKEKLIERTLNPGWLKDGLMKKIEWRKMMMSKEIEYFHMGGVWFC